MKRFGKKLLSLVLSAVLLCGALPMARAADIDPPLYEQFGYDSSEAFYRDVSVNLTWNDEWEYVPPASVQLNGETVTFPDAQPETVNSRTMVPFRTIAEALGAQVGYADGAATAEKDGVRYELAAGSDRMRVLDAQDGAVIREIQMDAAPYEKGGRTYVPVRFFAQAFGLTVQWDEREQTAVLYDREALIAALDERFTVVNEWLAAQPVPDGEQARYTAAAIRVLHTAFDSIDGDKQYTLLDGTLEVVSQGESMEMDIQMDLYALVQMVAEQTGGLLDEDLAQQVELIQEQLENVRFEMIYDADTDTLYLRCPLLCGLLAAVVPDEAGEVEIRETTSYGDTLTNCSFAFTDASGQLTISVHEKNQSITEMTIDLTQRVSDTAPAAEPPAGDPVIDLVDWFESLETAEQAA